MADRAVFLEKGQVRFEGAGRGARRTRRPRPGRVPRDGGRLTVVRRRDLDHAAARSSTASSPGWCSGCWRWASCSIYRSTRVINFAVGNMGLVGAGLLRPARRRSTASRSGSRPSIGLVPSASLFGAVIELVVIRRLFDAPRVIVLVATIGIAQLVPGDRHRVPGDRRPRRPLSRCRSARPGRRRRGPGHRPAARDPRRRAARRARARVVPQPHAARQGGQGVGREPRPGPPVGHQPEDRLHRGLGDRRLRSPRSR